MACVLCNKRRNRRWTFSLKTKNHHHHHQKGSVNTFHLWRHLIFVCSSSISKFFHIFVAQLLTLYFMDFSYLPRQVFITLFISFFTSTEIESRKQSTPQEVRIITVFSSSFILFCLWLLSSSAFRRFIIKLNDSHGFVDSIHSTENRPSLHVWIAIVYVWN